MSSGSGSSKSPPRGPSPQPNSSSTAAALAAAKAESERRKGELTRSRSPLLGNPRDGDATRIDNSTPAQQTAAVDDTPRAGGSGRAAPSSSGGFDGTTSHAATSDDRTPREGRPKLRFSHILVKHKNSRRPVDNDNKPVTRTKDQAMELIIDIHEKITKDLITFADAAVSFSDCTSARNEGDIHSRFKRGRMQTSFQNAALALGPGKISDIVETTSGFHIIQRGDSRSSVDSHRHSGHRTRSRSPRLATSRDGDATPTEPKPGQSTPRDNGSRGLVARHAVPLDGEGRPIEVRAGTARTPVARYAVARHAVTRHTVVRHAGARHVVACDAMVRGGTVPDVVTRDSTSRDSVARDGSSFATEAQVSTERNAIPKDEASDDKVTGTGASGDGMSIDESPGDGASVTAVSGDKASEKGKSKLRRIPIREIPRKSQEPVDVQKPVTRTQGEAMDLLIDIHESDPNNLITTVDAAMTFSDNESKTTGTYDDPSGLAINPGQISHNTESYSDMLQGPE